MGDHVASEPSGSDVKVAKLVLGDLAVRGRDAVVEGKGLRRPHFRTSVPFLYSLGTVGTRWHSATSIRVHFETKL